jgi:outer membrane protein assembly factor BamB
LDSWWGVLLVLMALLGTVASTIGLWWRVAPRPPSPLERYWPTSSGVSLVYHVTNPDGTTHYLSRNLENVPGQDILNILDGSGFLSLMTALGVDLDSFDPNSAQQALLAGEYARVVEIEYLLDGTFVTATTVLLVEPTSVGTLQLGSVAFDPPQPLLDSTMQEGSVQVLRGLINSSIPYTATIELEDQGPLNTRAGHFEDCLRVRHSIVVPGYQTDDRTWYCAGIGIARMESSSTTSPDTRTYELTSVSAPGQARAFAPPAALPISREWGEQAQLQRDFPQAQVDGLKARWSYQENRFNSGITTPALPVADLLLYGTQNGGLVALDLDRQKIHWRFQTGSTIYGAPIVADGLVFVTSSDRHVYALDLSTGAFRWAFEAQDAIPGSPAAAKGLVYVGAEDGTVYALHTHNGEVRWRFEVGGPIASTPVIADNLLYVASDDGALYTLDAKTGTPHWAFASDGPITASPATDGDVVYVGSQDKTLYALDARTRHQEGEVLWQFYAREEILNETLLSEGTVYLALHQDLYALDAASGEKRWHYASETQLYGVPLRLGGWILIRRSSDVLALDARTGAEIEALPTAGSSAYAGLSSDGQDLFASYFDGLLEVFALHGGKP